MKTQLLEDIGQSATLTLAPAKTGGNPKAGKEVHTLVPAGSTEPAGETPVSTTHQARQEPTPLELHSVFEEIAELEAQFVPPAQQHAPGIAPAEPRHETPGSPDEPLHKLAVPPAARLLKPAARPAEPLPEPAIPPAEPMPAPDPMQSPTVPQDPLFDFTMPLPASQAADPFTRPPTGLTRSRQRYLLWGACVLAGVLLILGGRWLYQERNDTGSLALIANEATEAPEVDKAVKRGAIAADESTQAPGGDLRIAPAAPASRPLPGVPPLVMLEPDPPAATELEPSPPPPPPSAAGRAEPQAPPKPEPVAEQEPAAPLPKPSGQLARAQSNAAAEPARERTKREPVRQPVRAAAIPPERPAGQDTTMTATLKACRERGYGPAQCVKRGCSMTRYGFACRGR